MGGSTASSEEEVLSAASADEKLFAFFQDCFVGNIENVRSFLSWDKKLRLLNRTDASGSGKGALHFALDSSSTNAGRICGLLLESGIDPNLTDNEGMSPLLVSVKRKQLEIAAMLMNKGADLLHRSRSGVSIFHLAAGIGSKPLIAEVLRRLAGSSKLAINFFPDDLKIGDHESFGTILHFVAGSPLTNGIDNICECARYVIDILGVDVNQTDYVGATALHYAAGQSYTPLVEALLNRKAKPNIRMRGGVTALHLATEHGNAAIAELLLNKHAVQYMNQDNLYPFDLAIQLQRVDIARMLQYVPKGQETADDRKFRLAPAVKRYKEAGNTAFQRQEFEEALSLFTKGLKMDPDDHILLSNRSATFYTLNKYEHAIEDAYQATVIQPGFARGYYRLAIAWLALHDLDAAENAAKRGLELDPHAVELRDVCETVRLERDVHIKPRN
eukprot:ANDGO_03847.mRNA.1 Hsp70-Hsp90 organizing protein 3